jgi:hypothetical protein
MAITVGRQRESGGCQNHGDGHLSGKVGEPDARHYGVTEITVKCPSGLYLRYRIAYGHERTISDERQTFSALFASDLTDAYVYCNPVEPRTKR